MSEVLQIVLSRRIKKIIISPEVLMHMMITGDKHLKVEGLPETSVFRGFAHDWGNNTISVFVEDESFENVPEGNHCPTFLPTFYQLTCGETK